MSRANSRLERLEREAGKRQSILVLLPVPGQPDTYCDNERTIYTQADLLRLGQRYERIVIWDLFVPPAPGCVEDFELFKQLGLIPHE